MERPKIQLTPVSITSRHQDDVQLAIERVVDHTLARHGQELEFNRRNLQDPESLRAFISTIVWDEETLCFQASNNREFFYHCRIDTRIILNFDADAYGTCLPVEPGKSGIRWFSDRYNAEIRDHDRAGFPAETMPPVFSGGLCALNDSVDPRCASVRRRIVCNPGQDESLIRKSITDWCHEDRNPRIITRFDNDLEG